MNEKILIYNCLIRFSSQSWFLIFVIFQIFIFHEELLIENKDLPAWDNEFDHFSSFNQANPGQGLLAIPINSFSSTFEYTIQEVQEISLAKLVKSPITLTSSSSSSLPMWTFPKKIFSVSKCLFSAKRKWTIVRKWLHWLFTLKHLAMSVEKVFFFNEQKYI